VDAEGCDDDFEQWWPTCLLLDRLENFLITRDQPVGNKVTSRKCHKMR